MKIESVGKIFPEITENDITLAEQNLNVKFPAEYVAYLLEQNGGYPQKNLFVFPDGSNSSYINYFYPIGDMTGNLCKKNSVFEGDFPDGFITIGADPGGNQILLGVLEDNSGKIYFWEHDVDPDEEDNIHFLSESLNSFLSTLKASE